MRTTQLKLKKFVLKSRPHPSTAGVLRADEEGGAAERGPGRDDLQQPARAHHCQRALHRPAAAGHRPGQHAGRPGKTGLKVRLTSRAKRRLQPCGFGRFSQQFCLLAAGISNQPDMQLSLHEARFTSVMNLL